MKRIRVRCLVPYGAKIDGEPVDRKRGEEVDEEPILAREMIAANWAELVEPPPASLTSAEAQAIRDNKDRRASELEEAAQGRGVEATTREPEERAARTGRAGR